MDYYEVRFNCGGGWEIVARLWAENESDARERARDTMPVRFRSLSFQGERATLLPTSEPMRMMVRELQR